MRLCAVDQKKANRARRKQIDEQSRLKERKTLQKKGLSQYDRNQFKGCPIHIDNCFFRNIIKTVLNVFKYIFDWWCFLSIELLDNFYAESTFTQKAEELGISQQCK
jgi:hypothetical protein